MAVSAEAFEECVLESFEYLRSDYSMTMSHDRSADFNVFRFAGDPVSVDVYFEFYSFQLGAEFTLKTEASLESSTRYPIQTMWRAVEYPEDSGMTALMPTTDQSLKRLVAELAKVVSRVVSTTSSDPLTIFRRAAELDQQVANLSRVRRFVSLLEESTSVRVVRGGHGSAKKKHLATLFVERDSEALHKLRFALRIRPLGERLALMTPGDPTLIFEGDHGPLLTVQCLGDVAVRADVLGEDAVLASPGRLSRWIRQRLEIDNS